jgi:hypothetical protein
VDPITAKGTSATKVVFSAKKKIVPVAVTEIDRGPCLKY